MQHWVRLYFGLPLFLRLLCTVLIFMFSFGIFIHFLEPDNFPTLLDGVWWAFVTGSTVGYGDYVPLSPFGKLTAILLILTGGGVVTFYMATLSASTVKHEQDLSEGKVAYKGKGHILLIGWNERTRQLMDMMAKYGIEDQIVLVDQTMNHFYRRLSFVHFIKGSATEEEVLTKANVQEAKVAIITADPSKHEDQSDQTVIHQIVALKGHQPNLHIIAEMLTAKQRINAERAGANTVVRSNDFMSSLFFHELFRDDPVQPFQLLLDLITEKQFHEETVKPQFIGKSAPAVVDFYLKQHSTVIGVRIDDKISFDLHDGLELGEEDRILLFTPLRH
ncbi:potassium channel protein [Halobacillus fulvus]|nr:potassium channel protein [Halobacillus fulvus]